MKEFLNSFFGFFCFLFYLAGIVAAPSWWKLFAVFFPPYALYAIVEKILVFYGVVN